MAEQARAKAVKERPRRVNFFELVKQTKSSTNERMEHADWPVHLRALQGLPLSSRVVESPARTLIGEVLSVNGKPHLKLMRVRDEHAWFEVYDPDAGSINDLDLAGVLLETSIVAFLDFGNVIGLIQGSASAPSSTAVAEWINGLGFVGSGVRVDTQAMVSHAAKEKLKKSSEASRIEAKVHTNKADALEQHGSKISSVLRTVEAEWGPMTVTVILQVSKARDNSEAREVLRAEASNLLAATDGNDVLTAKVNLLYIDADETTHMEAVDFVKQRITAKHMVSTTSDDGSPIRDASAVEAILNVAHDYEGELRKIVAE